MFAKGDVLVELEKYDYQTDLKLAEAELARAQAALEEEQARGKVAAEEWRSVNTGVAPELGLRKPQLAKEIANVRGAEAQLERAKRNLARTTIRAPYDGLVKAKQVDLGQFITVGSQLGLVYSTEVAEVRMPLTDNDLAYLQLSDDGEHQPQVTLTAKVAGRKSKWNGKLVRNEGVVDQQQRVIYAIAEIDDPYLRKPNASGNRLKFGRFVQAEIVGDRGEDLVVLPRSVLRLDGTVLVVDPDRVLRIKAVEVQRADEKYAYISSGLQSGELVATSAIPNPFDGMKVRLAGDKESYGDVAEEESTPIATAGVKSK